MSSVNGPSVDPTCRATLVEQAEPPRDPLRGDRQPRDAHTGRVLDRIGDGRGGWADGRLPDAARVEWSEPFAGFDDDRAHVGNVAAVGIRYVANDVVRLMPWSTTTSSMSP